MRAFAAVEQRQFDTGEIEYLPAVDGDGGEAAMPGREPWDYYGTERSAAPGWTNRVTRLSLRELLTFDAAIGADFLAGTPALFIHGRRDGFCSPEAADGIYRRAQSADKEFLWLDTTNHIDLYDNPAYVGPAVARLSGWLGRTPLTGPPSPLWRSSFGPGIPAEAADGDERADAPQASSTPRFLQSSPECCANEPISTSLNGRTGRTPEIWFSVAE